MKLTPLPWDSEFFGFPVVRLDLGAGDAADPALRECLAASPARVVYLFAEDLDDAGRAALAALGAVPAARKLTFARPLGGINPDFPDAVRPWTGPPSPELEQLAWASGQHSRFRLDPGFAPHYRRLYRQWLQNSLSGEIADAVLVARATGQPGADGVVGRAARTEGVGAPFAAGTPGSGTAAGPDGRRSGPEAAREDWPAIALVTLQATADCGVIGLLAVAGTHRGQGLGAKLLRAAAAWSAARGLGAVRVATQARNEAACRLYRQNGFHLAAAVDVFHLWRDARPAASIPAKS